MITYWSMQRIEKFGGPIYCQELLKWIQDIKTPTMICEVFGPLVTCQLKLMRQLLIIQS